MERVNIIAGSEYYVDWLEPEFITSKSTPITNQTVEKDMTDTDKILDKLKEVLKENPDLRLGQLLSIITYGIEDIFYLENDKFLKLLEEFNIGGK